MGKLGNNNSEVDFDGKAALEADAQGTETGATEALDSEGKFTETEGSATTGFDRDDSAAEGTGIVGFDTGGSEMTGTEPLGMDTEGREAEGRGAPGTDTAGSETDGKEAEGSPKLADASKGSKGPRMEAPGKDTEAPTERSGILADTAGPVTAGSEGPGNEAEGRPKLIEIPGKDAEALIVAPGTSTAGGVAEGSTADGTGIEGSPKDRDAAIEGLERPVEELGTEIEGSGIATDGPRLPATAEALALVELAVKRARHCESWIFTPNVAAAPSSWTVTVLV
ncbi:uncharacterized protein B0H64DRAFT_438432 [Chaetomium fimeti]|uniref:Uncharacterized protein n=1 Tax=Chaetomium fimeti TaxID=1854472 RepID=A0AAE0LXN3_9PEZI|nr:hypothetical protein B0H64DRAFT_438432 [Chaetomium fimeti]